MEDQYAYGFFDGEGAVVRHSSALEVHISQAQVEVLEVFKAKYGGQIRIHSPGPIGYERVNGIRRQTWRWKLVGYAAAKFLRDAEPHLLVKRTAVIDALKWWDERLSQRKRLRMPNSYYAEQKAQGRETATFRMSVGQLEEEPRRRAEWLKNRGWD